MVRAVVVDTVNLTSNFTMEEFTASEYAARHNIDNEPPPQIKENLRRMAMVMQDVRTALGSKSIYITSGYRCSKLNKAIGSKPTSAHVNGLACDFKCPSFGSPKSIVEVLAKSGIPYDQLILEYNSWVHIGLSANPRKQFLTVNEHGTFAGVHV